MAEPELDGRRRDTIFEYAAEIAPYYTDGWDPDDDAGTALLRVFAHLAEEVTTRVDRIPEKHRTAFYDTLGFSRRPPQAARLPIMVTVADGIDRTVPIQAGTRAVGDTPDQRFEVLPGDGFEATPAQLTAAYSVDPERDQIYDHSGLLTGDQVDLFRGAEGSQEHALHIGHTGQLAVEGTPENPTTVRVSMLTDRSADTLADRLDWEYYGERNGTEAWHPIETVTPPDHPSAAEPPDDRDVEQRLASTVTNTAVVLRRLDAELDPPTIETIIAAVIDLLEQLAATLSNQDTQDALAGLLDGLEVLVETLEDGPVEAAVRNELLQTVERVLAAVDTQALEQVLTETVGPAIGRLIVALDGGPVEAAVEDDLLPSLERLATTVEDHDSVDRLGREFDVLYQVLAAGATTGEVVQALETADLDELEAIADAIEATLEPPPRQRPPDVDTAVEEVLRALAEFTELLHAELVGVGLEDVGGALTTIVDQLRADTRDGPLAEPLEALADALHTLRTAIDGPHLSAALTRLADTLAEQIHDFDDGLVGEAVRTDLWPAIESLRNGIQTATTARAFVDAVVRFVESLRRGPIGEAIRTDLVPSLDNLTDTLGTSPLGDALRPLPQTRPALDPWTRRARRQADDLVRPDRPEAPEPDPDEPSTVGRQQLDLAIDGTPTETTVDGVEARWIRCRVPEAAWGSDLFDMQLGTDDGSKPFTPPVSVGPVPTDSVTIETLLSNDTELAIDGDGLYPLGQTPRQQDAFYIGAAEAFTKAGATIEVTFRNDRSDDVSFTITPEIAWEYWDGSAWARLPLIEPVEPKVKNMRTAGSLRFRVPEDLEATSVAGHDGHWIRARLVAGGYGRYEAKQAPPASSSKSNVNQSTDGENWITEHNLEPPQYEAITLRFTGDGVIQPVDHLITRNNLAASPDLVAVERAAFRPFVGLPDAEQTLYLGFDRQLADGPINLLFDLTDIQYAAGFHPRVRWERRTGDRWSRINVRDGTEGLTERGIVSLTFEAPTSATTRFGQDRHWLRARVAGDAFEPPTPDDSASGPTTRDTAERDPCGPSVDPRPPGGDPGRDHPILTGLYRNSGWAYNVHTVEDERLGSSDGTQNQTVTVADPPATTVEVWVDESEVLSEGGRLELQQAADPPVEPGPNAFWVRWTEVASFRDSDGDDRHYTVDPTLGRISFGDGQRGRIPPRGRDNLKASYRTGGGVAGNVPPDTVTNLVSSIPFVDSVRNPLPGDGGADEESVEGVLDRAPKELRDRDRAVTAADIERIARDTSRRITRARCLPALDRNAEHAPGWVTLLVVPGSPGEKPVPSVTLRERVRSEVGERAPTTLVAAPDQLVVRGPSYVTVGVDARVVTAGGGSLSQLEERVTTTVEEFLHPLTGGSEGGGWQFGEPPCHSDFYSLLERVDGVDHVETLVIRFHTNGSSATIHEGDEPPTLPPDALIHSGEHDLRAVRDSPMGGS